MSQNKINIGIDIDLQKLLDTRLLVQAGSGGGKSHALRKIIECVGNKIQQIIIDPEGEFVTLREKFDFLLVGKGGDIDLSLKYAETLAHKLLETNVSAIIDLYELRQHERILFVKRFLEALVNAPKELWHSCLVVIDEAHIFCPESARSESMSAVIDICTRGRKRGFAAVLATQRLSKLHKDAAAECLNKMIGRTGLDIDRKRAADELGFTTKSEVLQLRDLQPGEFHGFGPAISNEVVKFKVSPVITTHLQSGHRISSTTPTPGAIKKILSKLADIPEEAEKELRTKEELQREVTRLRTELTKVSKQQPAVTGFTQQQLSRAVDQVRAETKQQYETEISRKSKWIADVRRIVTSAFDSFGKAVENFKQIEEAFNEYASNTRPGVDRRAAYSREAQKMVDEVVSKKFVAPEQRQMPLKTTNVLGKCAREIILFLAQYPDREFSKAQVAIATGYSAGSGGFNNALSELNSRQLISRSGSLRISPDGFDFVNSHYGPIETKPYDIHTYSKNLGKCEKEIYSVLLENPEREFTKEEMGDVTGYSAGSGGFNNALSRMNTLQLIERRSGKIRLNPELVELM